MKASKAVALLTAVGLTFLTGCERLPLGGDASSETNAGNRSESSIARDRSMSSDSTAKATISMPAFPLLIEAASELSISVADYERATLSTITESLQALPTDVVEEMANEEAIALMYESLKNSPPICKHIDNVNLFDGYHKILFPETTSGINIGNLVLRGFSLMLAGLPEGSNAAEQPQTEEEALAKAQQDEKERQVNAYFSKHCGALPDTRLVRAIRFASEPCTGWPRETKLNAQSPELARAAREWATTVEVANYAGAEALRGLSANSLRDPEHAKSKIKDNLMRVSSDQATINTLLNAAHEKMHRSLNYNWSGNQKYPIEYTVDGRHVLGCDQQGWHLVSGNIEMFGGGKVFGQEITLALESTISTSVSSRSSSGSTQDAGTSNSTGARAGTQ